MKKTVQVPKKTILQDDNQYIQYMKEAIEMIDINTEKIKNGTIYQCENRIHGDPYTPFYFFPIYVG